METFQEHYDSMVRAIERYTPYVNMSLVDEAVDYARAKHRDQRRKDGSPYIIHPLAVAEIVAEIGLDTDSIVAALLHDCLEDTNSTHAEIARRFGPTVAELVEGVTKLTRVNYSTQEEQQMENLRKMFLAMSKDIRVILIKIADRLHNTRTMAYQTPEKQLSKSRETMDIYAPIAYRLGMQKIKWELEDISLKYLDPEGYRNLMGYLDAHQQESDELMRSIQKKLTERLSSYGIECSIYGRIKHIYSIYRKMKMQNKTIEELYDLYAIRVIVDSIPDCYNVLGHVHDLFTPVPGRFKDYISTPKTNMYQSLHTTVIGSEGMPFEVQIRTRDMHHTAEYGIAAHWKYKQGLSGSEEKEFEWIRQLLESQQESDAEDYIQTLKVDMFDDQVFVFSPRGKVISLPAGSTPIDFAYSIHSAVGNSMVGAKVNNRIASYDMALRNGDIVEIITSKSAKGPSRDWLKICKSNQARSKIKQWFKRERREENVAHGKSSFEAELRRLGFQPSVLQDEELLQNLLRRNSFDALDDMYAAIGYGGLTAAKAAGRVRDDLLHASRAAQPREVRESQKPKANPSGVTVEGIDSCMFKFSRCCTPVPGDDIVGFITKGFGVSIHRRDCPNAAAANDPDQNGRWVSASWNAAENAPFVTTLEIEATDRDGLLLDTATVLSTAKVRVVEISGKDLPGGRAMILISFEVRNIDELNGIRNRLRNLSGVTTVRRGQQ